MSARRRGADATHVALALIAVVCACAGFVSIHQKGGLPVVADPVVAVWIPEEGEFARNGAWRRVEVDGADALEVVLDGMSVGEMVRPVVRGPRGTWSYETPLVHYYDIWYQGLVLVVTAIYFALGFFVLRRRPKDASARLFFHLTFTIGLLIATTAGRYTFDPIGLGYLVRAVLYGAYGLGGVMLVHFALRFPAPFPRVRGVVIPLYAVGGILAIATFAAFMFATLPRIDQGWLDLYARLFGALQWFMAAMLILGVGSFVLGHRRARTMDDRLKLRWILLGSAVSVLSFALLRLVPNLVGIEPLLGESAVTLLSAIAPVTFAVAIARHRALDIDLLISRSSVYVVVVATLLVLYALLVAVAASWFGEIHAVAAVVVALLFEPLRARAERWVDGRFFRQRYNFREALDHMAEDLSRAVTLDALGEAIVKGIDRVLAPERVAVLRVEPARGGVRVLAHRGFGRGAWKSGALELAAGLEEPPRAAALDRWVEPGIDIAPLEAAVSTATGAVLVQCVGGGPNQAALLIALGPRRSETRYTREDVDLVRSVAVQAGMAVDRILLQIDLLVKQAESERLAELNRMKSEFVAGVSHELKTPLTSIRMFAELIEQSAPTAHEQSRDFARIIGAEGSKLQTLIDNVLDQSRVEQNPAVYRHAPIDLDEVVDEAVETVRFQLESGGYHLTRARAGVPLRMQGDAEALTRAVVNLLSNAMKYGGERRGILVTTFAEDGGVGVSVADDGIGIPDHERPRLFEPFFRGHGALSAASGTGLGLSLVRQIVQGHGGVISLESHPGDGTTFTLTFPQEPADATTAGHRGRSGDPDGAARSALP